MCWIFSTIIHLFIVETSQEFAAKQFVFGSPLNPAGGMAASRVSYDMWS